MFSDWLMNSTIAVPAELGPTARPWSGGLTSPMTGLLAALMAEVRPSKPCSPVTLELVNPVSPAAAAALTAEAPAAAFPADGGSRRGVSRERAPAFGAAVVDLLASAVASARRLTVPIRCRPTGPPVARTCEVLSAGCAVAAKAAGMAAEASATAPATHARTRNLWCPGAGGGFGWVTVCSFAIEMSSDDFWPRGKLIAVRQISQ